jgi:XTP/dITP diphosphohydrolase
MKLVFATHNKNKLKEVQALLPGSFQLISLDELGCFTEIPETAETIEGNAVLKADFVTQRYNLDCFADDTGLEVEALNGKPGVYSARYAGEEKNDEANIQKLLNELKGNANRSAQFKTVIALNFNSRQYLFPGICEGKITEEKRGTGGFGYDAVFQPDGSDKTFAEMNLKEKSAISHRGMAFRDLIDFLST